MSEAGGEAPVVAAALQAPPFLESPRTALRSLRSESAPLQRGPGTCGEGARTAGALLGLHRRSRALSGSFLKLRLRTLYGFMHTVREQRRASAARPKAHVDSGAQLNDWEWRTPPEPPEDPGPGGDISWGAINNCPPLPVIFPELVSFVEGVE